jgi:hypothetical protein
MKNATYALTFGGFSQWQRQWHMLITVCRQKPFAKWGSNNFLDFLAIDTHIQTRIKKDPHMQFLHMGIW